MSRDNGLELKVGLFVLMAALALTFFIISISDLSIFEKGRHIQVVFGFASGLREAAPVRLAGVEVGLVKKLEVFMDEMTTEKPRCALTYGSKMISAYLQIPRSRSINWGF